MKNTKQNNSQFNIKNLDPEILDLEGERLGDIFLVDVVTDDPFAFVNGVLIISC